MMSRTDIYFLTEVVEPTEYSLIQYGILLHKDHPGLPSMGVYDSEVHLAWIEERRRLGDKEGWESSEHVDRHFILYKDMEGLEEVVKAALGQIRWERAKSTRDHGKGGWAIRFLHPQVRLSIISWLHERELEKIIARMKELEPLREGNPLNQKHYEFHELAKNVLEHWYVLNGPDVPVGVTGPRTGIKKREAEPIKPSPDYSTVEKDDNVWNLLPKQAAIIRKLHEVYNKEGPGATIKGKELLEYVASFRYENGCPTRVNDIFSGRREAYHDLVKVVSKRLSLYRLNV